MLDIAGDKNRRTLPPDRGAGDKQSEPSQSHVPQVTLLPNGAIGTVGDSISQTEANSSSDSRNNAHDSGSSSTSNTQSGNISGTDKDSKLMPPPPVSAPVTPLGPRPTAASLGLKESIEECMRINQSEPEEEDSGILDLTGIDDEELDMVRHLMSLPRIHVLCTCSLAVESQAPEKQKIFFQFFFLFCQWFFLFNNMYLCIPCTLNNHFLQSNVLFC